MAYCIHGVKFWSYYTKEVIREIICENERRVEVDLYFV
jgi:hypothetical protein